MSQRTDLFLALRLADLGFELEWRVVLQTLLHIRNTFIGPRTRQWEYSFLYLAALVSRGCGTGSGWTNRMVPHSREKLSTAAKKRSTTLTIGGSPKLVWILWG